MARIAIIVGLFVYVVIFEVVIRKGYLQKDEPLGFASMSLRVNSEGDTYHCCPSDGCGRTCTGAAGCAMWTQESSCKQQGCTWSSVAGQAAFGSQRGKLECVHWDRHEILHPATEEYSSLLTTRVTVSESQALPATCRLNRSSEPCQPWEAQTKNAYYTTGVEDMTIRVGHGVYGRETNKVVRAQAMARGTMKRYDGKEMYTLCGGVRPGWAVPYDSVSSRSCTDRDRTRSGDTFTVRQLLELAGIDTLDGNIQNIKRDDDDARLAGYSSNDTMRYDGVVLLVLIGYDGHGVDTELTYTYRVYPLGGLDFKTEQPLYNFLPNGTMKREIYNRHGIRIVLGSAGYIAVFSFVELLKTLTVASSLLSVAKFVVEFLLIRLLPHSTVYKRYRDVKTVDFSDYSKTDFGALRDEDYALGVIRNDPSVTLGGIHADDEREPGDKVDDKVQLAAANKPSPPRLSHKPFAQTSTDPAPAAAAPAPVSAAAASAAPPAFHPLRHPLVDGPTSAPAAGNGGSPPPVFNNNPALPSQPVPAGGGFYYTPLGSPPPRPTFNQPSVHYKV